MRSNGLATMMLLIPVLTVPALAIFGIPQFAPVVASPLDEGQEKGKESRVGNSARQSHDDLFADVDEIDSEFAAQDNFPSHRRESKNATNPNTNRANASRRPLKSGRMSWSDDLDEESELPSKSPRRSVAVFDDTIDSSRPNSGSLPRKSTISDRTARAARRDFDDSSTGHPVRVAAALDEGQSVVSAGFADESEQETTQNATRGDRSRRKDSRSSKLRESENESLTWQRAVERLNGLDIRNFRLEPGHQLGQFVFICSYTPPDNPRVSYRFEAVADEPLKAVEKVLEQIVQWQQSR